MKKMKRFLDCAEITITASANASIFKCADGGTYQDKACTAGIGPQPCDKLPLRIKQERVQGWINLTERQANFDRREGGKNGKRNVGKRGAEKITCSGANPME